MIEEKNYPEFLQITESIKYKILVSYCVFQILYALTLSLFTLYVGYRPEHFIISFFSIVPACVAALYFAKSNFHITSILYISYSFILQTVHLFLTENPESIVVIAMTVYLLIAMLSTTILSLWVGIAVIALGIVCIYTYNTIALTYEIQTNEINILPIHILVYSLSIFGFFAYLVRLFWQYLNRYLKQYEVSNDLNQKLKQTIDTLNDLNCKMEENIAALSDANQKLNKYAWSHSHELRAPVARIIGLMNILKLDNNLETPKLREAIYTTAQELDDVMKNMNTHLQDIIPIEYEHA
jgi:signal transduction histidine kinase